MFRILICVLFLPMSSDECEELANERDVQSPQSPQALVQKALNKKSPKAHSNYRFLADYEDLTLMAKRRTEGTDWYHIRKWAIGAKAEVEILIWNSSILRGSICLCQDSGGFWTMLPFLTMVHFGSWIASSPCFMESILLYCMSAQS